MEELKCFICNKDLLENSDYTSKNGQPQYICSDEKCDEENRMVLPSSEKQKDYFITLDEDTINYLISQDFPLESYEDHILGQVFHIVPDDDLLYRKFYSRRLSWIEIIILGKQVVYTYGHPDTRLLLLDVANYIEEMGFEDDDVDLIGDLSYDQQQEIFLHHHDRASKEQWLIDYYNAEETITLIEDIKRIL